MSNKISQTSEKIYRVCIHVLIVISHGQSGSSFRYHSVVAVCCIKAINPVNWCKVFLSYDNMCHLDGLKAARKPLPWAAPWDKAWCLHIMNHKDKTCQEKYDPQTLKEEIPDGNTMAAEQTFEWLSRFKKMCRTKWK